MKIGVILVGFNMQEYVQPCLDAWIRARKERLDGHEFVICAVSLPFAGFPNDTQDLTTVALQEHAFRGDIDHVIHEPKNIPESTARGMALRWLMDKGVDVTIQVDLDEFYTIQDISRIFAFVSMNPWTAWFRVALKNFVFDDKTYLVEPFCPPRIHRVKVGSYETHSFSGDNDIAYGGTITRDIIHQDNFPSMSVPVETAWVRHMSWPNSPRSRDKVRYQESRNWQCSFAWDDSKGGLIFNPALPTPKNTS